MSATEIQDHEQRARDNLIAQFQQKPDLEALLNSYIEQIQDLETVYFDLVDDRTLDSAIGAQLDGIGDIVGEDRQSRSDADYRLAIRSRIIVNNSTGTTEDLNQLGRSLLGSTFGFEVSEIFPAGLIVQLQDPIDPVQTDPQQLINFFRATRAAGVRLILTFGIVGSFRYDSGPGYDVGVYGGALE